MTRLTILSFLISSFYSFDKQEFQGYKPPENKFYDIAFDLRDVNSDRAVIYFYKAKDLFLKRKDSLNAGKCMVNLAIIATNKGDYFSGQELSLKAYPYFNIRNYKHHAFIKSNYNNLAIATYRLKDYKKSLTYYDLAIKYAVDSSDIRTYWNNKANSYRELKDFKTALVYYRKSLHGQFKPLEYARAITNLSYTRWLQNSEYNAAPELLKALYIREQQGDFLSQNSSYSHLSDFYRASRSDSALFFATKMYKAASLANSPDDKLAALGKMISIGPSLQSKRLFANYFQLADSLETARNAAKNQFILIIHDVQKSKEDNLLLQKDNVEKQYQIAARELWLTGAVLFFIAGAIIITLWYKKRKQKMESEKQNAVRVSQLKTSKKVHDVVANGLYRAISEIENQDQINKERILDRLAEMYEKSRDISYDVDSPMRNPEDFHDKMIQLVDSFRAPTVEIMVEGNNRAIWLNVSATVKHEIEHIVQELMVNMKRHSLATQVRLEFQLIEKQFHISYSDNGIGIQENIQVKNGLTNTGNRIKSISGVLTFETKVEKGTKILISFPVAN